jgi:hypothetical protein
MPRWAHLVLIVPLGACRAPAPSSSAPPGSSSSSRVSTTTVETQPTALSTARAAVPVSVAQLASDALTLRVTPSDLLVERAGATAPVFSYAAWARAAFERDLAALAEGEDAGAPVTVRDIEVRPVSWVGPLLSFKERTFTTMPGREAHPAGETRFVTLHVDGKPPLGARTASLAEYFDEKVLESALRQEPRVRRALGQREKPVDLAELLRALAEAEPSVGDECYAFPGDLLSRFCFDRFVGERVAVRVALPGAAVCREQLTEVELLLPIPTTLARPLAAAAAGRTGFVASGKSVPTAQIHLRLSSKELRRR